jgi:hypothetical protein
MPTSHERDAAIPQLLLPHGLVALGAAAGGAAARFVCGLPGGRGSGSRRTGDASGPRAGPGRRVPTASGRAPSSSGNGGAGGSGGSGWLRGSSAGRIAFRAGLGGIGAGLGMGGAVRARAGGRARGQGRARIDEPAAP